MLVVLGFAYATPTLLPPVVSTMIVWRSTGVAEGIPASQIRFPALSNSEKTAVPLTVPEFVVTLAKPL